MAILILLSALLLNAQDTSPEWQRTGPLLNARAGACALSLPDGRVLVTGGSNSEGPLNSAEIYSTTEGAFIPFTSMDKPRVGHRCLVLFDERVLLIGGDTDGQFTASLYDPAIDTWLPVGNFGPTRTAFSATKLDDGQILIAGGLTSDGPAASLLLINPVTFESTTATAKLAVPRSGHTANLLPGGRVIFIGGNRADGPTASVELYDPANDTMPLELTMLTPRRDHTTTLLNDGRLLILGGSSGTSDLHSAEIFNPANDTLTALSATLNTARNNHFALLMAGNGGVLISGGSNSSGTLASSELFSPETNTFTTIGNLTAPRSSILAAMLPDGTALAVGGLNDNIPSTACGVLTLNSISFTKSPNVDSPMYLAGERVDVRGTFPLSGGGSTVTFSLSRTLNLVSTNISNRLLTTSATLDLRGSFAAVGIFNPTADDGAATFTLTVRNSRGASVTRNFVTRIRTTLTATVTPASRTIVNQPVPVKFELSAANGATLFPGSVSGFISSASASSLIGPGGTGTVQVCCIGQIGPFPGQLTYPGTAILAPVASNAFTHTVIDNLPRVSLRAPSGGLRLLTPATFEILVSPPDQVTSPAPRGAVDIALKTISLSTPAGSTTSVATLTYTPTFDDRRNGTVCFAPVYRGDTAYKRASAPSQCFPVAAAAPALTISTLNNSTNFGESTRVTVQLKFNPELGLVSRTVAITGRSGAVLGLVNLTPSAPGLASGVVNLVLATDLDVPTIRAEYAASGDLDRAAILFTPALNPIDTRIQIVAPTNPVLNPFSISASLCTVTAIPVPGMSGQVRFLDGTLNLGTVSLTRGTTIPVCPRNTSSDGTSNTILFGEGGNTQANVTLTGISRPSGTRQISAIYDGFDLITNGPPAVVRGSTSLARPITVQ
ncbi:MAG: hypothetical protein FJW36_03825 [Acidobacteria bacterium]|nr:hypothetical protein [Acidobacteriota bacterium]